MKNTSVSILLIAQLLLVSCGEVKESKSTKLTEVEDFVELSDQDGFAEKHDEPIGIEVELQGEMITIPVEGGEEASIYTRTKEGSKTYLFVIHEWWGLNDHIKLEADRWYDKLGGVNVLALDLYDGDVATTREQATEYMKGADQSRIEAIIDAAIATLPIDAKVGTIGWCFGGGWSLQTALRAGTKTLATVMYYGMPIEKMEELLSLNSDVLFIYGTQDQWINESVATVFTDNMNKAGKELKVLAFDADHAFANPSSEHYIEQAAQNANEAALDYFRDRLK